MYEDNFQIGRNDPCPCGSGKKYKKCCGVSGKPVHFIIGSQSIPYNDLINTITYHRRTAYLGTLGRRRKAFCITYSEHKKKKLEYISKEQIKTAHSMGKSISCHKGCSFCCDEIIPVRIQESEAIVYYLYQNEIALSGFIKRFPAWYNETIKHQDILVKIGQAKNNALFYQSDTTDQMIKTVASEAKSFWEYHIHCPFLINNSCSIYEIRPYVCAGLYSLDPSEYCNPSSEKLPTLYSAYAHSDDIDMSFWDERLNVIDEEVLPNVVMNTLTSGLKYMSENIPGLGQLYEDFQNDPELHDRK